LISMEQSPIFAYRLKRKLLSGPIKRGAYKRDSISTAVHSLNDIIKSRNKELMEKERTLDSLVNRLTPKK
jgi:hypothetical protein